MSEGRFFNDTSTIILEYSKERIGLYLNCFQRWVKALRLCLRAPFPLIEEIFNLRPKKFSLSSVHLNSDIQANGSRMHFMRGNVFVKNQQKIVSLKKEQDSSLTKTLQELYFFQEL